MTNTRRTSTLFPLLIALSRVPGINGIHRSIGALDPVIKLAVDACFTTPQNTSVGYAAGKCVNLINCIMGNLASADQAGLSAGASISALLPTVLALCGAGPMELVQLAFASPLRAAATCLFGVGLPQGLFRQLRANSPMQMHAPDGEAETRTWKIPFSHARSRLHIARRLVADAVIIMLAGVMLWRNWVVGSITMVTFRCEYSWLLFCWPMACLFWLALATATPQLLAKEIEITLDGKPSSFWHILSLPYRYRSEPKEVEVEVEVEENGKQLSKETNSEVLSDTVVALHDDNRWASSEEQITQEVYHRSRGVASVAPSPFSPTFTVVDTPPPTARVKTFAKLTPPEQSFFTVRIVMWSPAIWGWYEAAIETIAVGIYLYATIVLCSILFLTGQQSIEYTVLMVLSLSIIRVVGSVM